MNLFAVRKLLPFCVNLPEIGIALQNAQLRVSGIVAFLCGQYIRVQAGNAVLVPPVVGDGFSQILDGCGVDALCLRVL